MSNSNLRDDMFAALGIDEDAALKGDKMTDPVRFEITCEMSGLVFLAQSKRARLHPGIKRIKEAAFQNGKNHGEYADTRDAIIEGRGIGLSTLAQFEKFIAQRVEEGRAQRAQRRADREAEQAQISAYWEAIRAENHLLRSKGYRWVNTEEDGFVLLAPTGHETDRDSALRACGKSGGSVEGAPFATRGRRPDFLDSQQPHNPAAYLDYEQMADNDDPGL